MGQSIKSHERLKLFDDDLRKRYGPVLVATDESARGSWAGPLAAGAVLLPSDSVIEGLNDSKLLSRMRREELNQIIQSVAIGWAVVMISPEEIDERGINWANCEAMERAAQEAIKMSGFGEASIYVIDQCQRKPSLFPQIMFPKADGVSLSVAAASVLAKVARDREMKRFHEEHPQYKWDLNKGYVRPDHIEAVNTHGLLAGFHRFSYQVKGVRDGIIPKPKAAAPFYEKTVLDRL